MPPPYADWQKAKVRVKKFKNIGKKEVQIDTNMTQHYNINKSKKKPKPKPIKSFPLFGQKLRVFVNLL